MLILSFYWQFPSCCLIQWQLFYSFKVVIWSYMMGRPTEEMVDNGILVVWTRNGAQIDVMFYFNPTDYGTVCRLSHSKYGYLSKSMTLSHWRWIWKSEIIVHTHCVPCSCLTYTRQEPTCPQLAGRYLWRHLDISLPTNPELWFWKFDFPTLVCLLQHVCWCWQTPNNRFVSLVKLRRGEPEKQRSSAGDVEICTTRVQLPYTIHSTPYIPSAWINGYLTSNI